MYKCCQQVAGAKGARGPVRPRTGPGTRSLRERAMTPSRTAVTTPCFTPGTLVATARGPAPVETLRPGDRVVTRDDGLCEVLWIARRTVTFAELGRSEEFRPVLIAEGALGNGGPRQNMFVSPRHRFLMMRGGEEVLTPAHRLVDGRG